MNRHYLFLINPLCTFLCVQCRACSADLVPSAPSLAMTVEARSTPFLSSITRRKTDFKKATKSKEIC